MYFKLPSGVPIGSALAFAGVLAVAQLVEGTTPSIAFLSFLFIFISALAFNIAGGFVYPSGAFIASCTILTATVGMVAKVFLGEPFQRNLLVPERTLEVYVIGVFSMLAASYVNRLMRPRRAVLDRFEIRGNSQGIGVICLFIAIVAPLVLPDAVVSTFNQANGFVVLAIMIPVFDTVRRTGGQRSFNFASLAAWAYMTTLGIFAFSKEGMFGPSAAWVIAAVGAGYHASYRKLAVLGVIGVLAVSILTPYSQLGRNYGRTLDISVSIPLAFALLSHPLDLREAALAEATEQQQGEGVYHLFDKPQGLLDRLNMISVDDALIRATDRGQTAVPGNLWSYFTNLIPRYVYPDKPTLLWGNTYAHLLGMLSDDDESTGISFSPFADGYHCALWTGVTIYSFGMFLFGFFMMDAVGGSVDRSFWAILYVLFTLHAAPEGMLNAPVYCGGTYTVFVIVLAYTCSRVIPILTNLVKTPEAPTPTVFASNVQNVQSV